ncbi:hypothetical protein SC08_Contig83orf00346 [Clostridium butyricum]|nr:hypothetical protein SC08_Contig83orf00346 [Clostridium butyricum]
MLILSSPSSIYLIIHKSTLQNRLFLYCLSYRVHFILNKALSYNFLF